MATIRQKVQILLDRFGCKDKSVLIAFSGGRDSMALLHLLSELQADYRLKLAAAYINHNLRGTESSEEKSFVAGYLKKTGLPYFITDIAADYWNNNPGLSVEMAARKFRYQYLQTLAIENRFDLIATAHHFNDRIETFFLRLFQAGGLDTLSAIPAKNKIIIRPLIDVTRTEINRYLLENQLPNFEDSTNQTDHYRRNIIRNRLLPVFKRIHPRYEDSFTHVFNFINEEQQLIRYLTRSALNKMVLYKTPYTVCLNKTFYQRCLPALQKYILKAVLKMISCPAVLSLPLLNALSGKKDRYIYQKKPFYCRSKAHLFWLINLDKQIPSASPLTIPALPYMIGDYCLERIGSSNKIPDPKKYFLFQYHPENFPLYAYHYTDMTSAQINPVYKKQLEQLIRKSLLPEPLFRDILILETAHHTLIGIISPFFHRVLPEFYLRKNSVTACILKKTVTSQV